MTTIAEAYVQLKPSMRGFTSEMNSQIGPEMDGAGRYAGKSFGGGMIPMLGGMAVAGAAALVGLGVAGVGAGVSTAASMEQARIAFTTMLGSAEQADTFLKQLAQFAAETPFEFPELQTAASSLISAGVQADKVIPIMKTLGNVTSGMGTGSEGVKRATVALQQMQAAGKITGEDLNQLRDAGIPVYDLLAAATGKSKDQIVALAQAGKLGKKELDAMMGALESGKGLERFNGLMEAQSQSLSGLWSTFGDNLNMGLAKAVEPLIPMLKDGLGKTATWLGETAMPALATGFKLAVDNIGPLIDSVRLFWGTFTGEGADTNLAEDKINGIIDAGASARNVFDELAPALASIGESFRNAYAVIAPIVQQISGAIMDKLGPLMPTIVGIFRDAFEVIAGIINIAVQVIQLVWSQWGATILTYTQGRLGFIVNVIATAVDIIKGIVKAVSAALKGDWSGAWDAIKDATSAAWGHLKSAFSDGASAVGAVMNKLSSDMGHIFESMWQGAKSVGTNIMNGIVQGIRDGVQWVKDAITGLAGDIVGWFSSTLHINSPSKVMADKATSVPEGVALGITRGAGYVNDAMNGLTSRITGQSFTATGTSSLTGPSGFGGASPNQALVLMIGGQAFDAYLTTRDQVNAVAESNLLRAGRGS